MAMGLVGRKCGMTQLYTEEGLAIPVTVIEVTPNRVTQIKLAEREGYNALQITFGDVHPRRLTKPQKGHYAKAQVKPGHGLWEFRVNDSELKDVALGREFNVELFREGQMVDVAAISKGKGFAGTVKRHNFATQDATHGNSLSHRAPGSIGQRQSPGRVFKGKKMSGQMGNKRCTIQSQKIVRVDAEKHLFFIKGGVPGAPGGYVIVRPAVRFKNVEGGLTGD